MKKARSITIPANRPLTYEEFVDFNEHAIKSSSWYASEYIRTKKQITDKLLAKGYIMEDVVYVGPSGEEISYNIIDGVLQHLSEYYLINDDEIAKSIVSRYSTAGRGRNFVRAKLIEKGIDPNVADSLLEDIDKDDVLANVRYAAERYMGTSSYTQEENDFKRSQKLTKYLISRGFSFDDISAWRDNER